MANICENKFYFTCENNFDYYLDEFNRILNENLDGTIIYSEPDEDGGGCIECGFDSKWSFPYSIFEPIFNKSGKEDNVYFRCLSEEYGCGYVAMNIYSDGDWLGEQTFDL